MPSLRDKGTKGKVPQRPQSMGKRPSSKRTRPSKLPKASKAVTNALNKTDCAVMRLTHDHLLNLLREEAKDLDDPLLIYLYDMVIYRTREAFN